MKVSGSILATDGNYLEYAKELKKAKIDYLHIDIFQDSKCFRLDNLYEFDDSYLPLDVHLIFSHITEKNINILNDVKAEFLNIQYESLVDKDEIRFVSRRFNGKFGIAVTAETSLDIIDKYIEDVSQVLIMCSTPGVSGAKFNEENFERVEKIRNKYPSLKIIVDGGVNKEIGKAMGELGADILVSGSYLCKDMLSLTRNGYYLKYMNESNINVKRNMLSSNELPIVNRDEIFMNIILTMNKYRLGLVFVVEGQELCGIISDGEVRRNLIKYNEDIFYAKASQLMNENPFCVDSEMCLEEVYDKLFETRRGIDVVPIIDSGMLIGALDLHMGK